MRIKTVIQKLKKERGNEIHQVPGTGGRIDQEEGRGYLLGAVLGRGLLTRKEAADAGLDARNKLTALEKRLTFAKEAARKAGRKVGGDVKQKQCEARAIEHEHINIDLPPPGMPPPKQPPKRKREHGIAPWTHHFALGRFIRCETAANVMLAESELVQQAAKRQEAASAAVAGGAVAMRRAEAAIDALEEIPPLAHYALASALVCTRTATHRCSRGEA